MTERKQTEIERAFTLLARSNQWEAFVGSEVNVRKIDKLIGMGNLILASTLLQWVTDNRLLPTLVKHIICAREAYLDSRDVDDPPRPTSQPVGHIVPRR